MSEMIERVEKAIDDCLSADLLPSEIRAAARAAIETMREPTQAMLDAGPPEPYMDRDVWAKMIDAALGEPR